jgi:hypothetical protein
MIISLNGNVLKYKNEVYTAVYLSVIIPTLYYNNSEEE